MKILKKLPRWVLIVLALVLFAFMASTLVQHFTTKSRVDSQRERIKQQQQTFFREHSDMPSVQDILDGMK